MDRFQSSYGCFYSWAKTTTLHDLVRLMDLNMYGIHKTFVFPTAYLQGCMMPCTSKHDYHNHKWQLALVDPILKYLFRCEYERRQDNPYNFFSCLGQAKACDIVANMMYIVLVLMMNMFTSSNNMRTRHAQFLEFIAFTPPFVQLDREISSGLNLSPVYCLLD